MIYFLFGVVCLVLFGALMYAVYPRAGRATTGWASTNAGSEITALALVTLFVFGIGMVLRGFVG